MQIIFARHGESEANVKRIISNRNLPHPLTEKGRRQANAMANYLADMQVTAIYASPILRAQETANIVADKLNLPAQTADALGECDCGTMEGRGDAEAWDAHDSVEKAWDAGDHVYRIAEGESFNDVRSRFEPFIAQIIEDYGNSIDTIVLVSHGAILHHMLPLVLANIDRAFTQQHQLRNTACIVTELREDRLVCLSWDGLQSLQ